MMVSIFSRGLVCVAVLGLVGCSDSDKGSPGGGGSGDTNEAGETSASGGSSSGSSSGGSKATGGSGSSGKAGGGTGGGEGGSAGKGDAGGSTGGKAPGIPRQGCDLKPSDAPEMKWVNATGNLANMQSNCGNLGLVSAQPCSNRVIAGVARKGLFETLDGGQTWTPLGQGAGSDPITNTISSIVYDPLDPSIFWESGIYGDAGGVYKTTDNGQTIKRLGDVYHCDSLSIDFLDPERKTLLAGAHETNTKLSLSTDGGNTWTNIANGLPDGQCTATVLFDPKTFLVGCNSGTIVRTEDQGATWKAVPGSSLGGAAQPLITSDGTIYWAGNGGGISKSEDSGRSFTAVATPAEAPSIIPPIQLVELPDGRIVIIGKDHLLASADKGATWKPIGEPLPFMGGGYDGVPGVTYSALTKTFFVWHWDCGEVVHPDAIMSMGFDWEKM